MSEPQLMGIPGETLKELKNRIEKLKAVKAYLLIKLSNCETYIQGMTDLVKEIEATQGANVPS